MYDENEDVFYYLTDLQREVPDAVHARRRRWKAFSRGSTSCTRRQSGKEQKVRPQLFGSGTILNGVLKAQQILKEKYGDRGRRLERHELQRASARRHGSLPLEPASPDRTAEEGLPRSRSLADAKGPFIAASDNVRAGSGPGPAVDAWRPTSLSEPTASAAAIRVRLSGGTSRSMPSAPPTRRSKRLSRQRLRPGSAPAGSRRPRDQRGQGRSADGVSRFVREFTKGCSARTPLLFRDRSIAPSARTTSLPARLSLLKPNVRRHLGSRGSHPLPPEALQRGTAVSNGRPLCGTSVEDSLKCTVCFAIPAGC